MVPSVSALALPMVTPVCTVCCPLPLRLVPFAPCRSVGSPSPLLANVRELRFRMQLPHSTLPMLKVRRIITSAWSAPSARLAAAFCATAACA